MHSNNKQRRKAILSLYPDSPRWTLHVGQMSNNQVFDIYNRLSVPDNVIWPKTNQPTTNPKDKS